MAWYAVDDEFPAHPKLESLEDDYVLHSLCVACWTLLGADCARRRTGGFVSKARLAKVLAFWPQRARDRAAAALVAPLKLWEPAENGWKFHDWDHYQPSADELAEEKNLKTERQRRWRQGQRQKRIERLRVDAMQSSTPASTCVDASASTPASTAPSTVDSGARATRDRAQARVLPSPDPQPQSPPPLATLGSELAHAESPGVAGQKPLAGALAAALDSLSTPATDREQALHDAETLVRVEFARRFEQAEGTLWTLAGDPAVVTLAAWALSVHGGPEAAVRRLLDGFFADDWARSTHYSVRHLAKYPQKYFEPRAKPSAGAPVDTEAEIARLRAQREELKSRLTEATIDGNAERETKLKARIDELNARIRAMKGGA